MSTKVTIDFLFASAFQLFLAVLIVVSSLYFYVSEDVAVMSKKSFTWTEQMFWVYRDRTKGEGCVHVKSI